MEQKIKEAMLLSINDKMEQLVISKPTTAAPADKIKVRPVEIKGDLLFQAALYKGTKVYHSNYSIAELMEQLEQWLGGMFLQAQLNGTENQITVLISKKGKVSLNCKKNNKQQMAVKASRNLDHNREKEYLIKAGEPVPFLVDLGVMSREGDIIHSKYDKFRQINRFLEFIEDVLPALPAGRELNILDFGCGKSYLTFAMYYYLKVLKGFPVRITGLDLKEDVIKSCNECCKRYGYEGLTFITGDIAAYEGAEAVDMVVALHACDTATDYAIEKAVRWGASVILAVPCCQHELNRQISNDVLKPVLKYGIIKERIAALVTDALRAELLEQHGYKAQILEFIDMEHTPKNLLIRAVKTNHLTEKKLKEVKIKQDDECMAFLHTDPLLKSLLQEL